MYAAIYLATLAFASAILIHYFDLLQPCNLLLGEIRQRISSSQEILHFYRALAQFAMHLLHIKSQLDGSNKPCYICHPCDKDKIFLLRSPTAGPPFINQNTLWFMILKK